MNFSIYPVLAALLDYPEPELLVALDEVEGTLAHFPAAQDALQPLLALLKGHPLIELQENYVATFDRNPAHSASTWRPTNCPITCRCSSKCWALSNRKKLARFSTKPSTSSRQ
jgi:hypothetical protein